MAGIGKYIPCNISARNLKRRDSFGYLDCNEIECEGVDRTCLVQDRVQFLAVVKVILSFRVPQKAEILLTS